jgi:DNA (cytosine-5)-methyltransferase 1
MKKIIDNTNGKPTTETPIVGMQCCGQPFRVLNLYACLGGNRYLWDNCEVTAVELDPDLARMYQERFPNDKVIIDDAHQYLLDHYKEFDFIWSSPPCPSHSKSRFARHESTVPEYPDMKLYQEIIFLDNYFKGKYCVENVIPFYEPLIPAKKRGRHLYWTNFNLPNILSTRKGNFMEGEKEVEKWCEFHKIDLSGYKGEQRKDKIARNLVDYEAGLTIFNTARGIMEKSNSKQISMWDAV